MEGRKDQIQKLLGEAVHNGVAPGFQFAVFNKNHVLAKGAVGYAVYPSSEDPVGVSLRSDHLLWMASCIKIIISMLTLHILEHGITENKMTLGDLDNHEKLVEILHEFKHGSGSPVTKIIDGFEDELGPDGKKVPILHDAVGKVTLRMLLTHTSGSSYQNGHPHINEMFNPSDGSPPLHIFSGISGKIKDFAIPLAAEPNTEVLYGFSSDWLGQFIVRSTGLNLRQAMKKYIFEPLGISSPELEIYLSPEAANRAASMHIRSPESTFLKITPPNYQTEGDVPSGFAHNAGGGLFGTMSGFATLLQAALRHDPRILSENAWRMATADSLEDRRIKVPVPRWGPLSADVTAELDYYAKSTQPDGGSSINLFQCELALAPTLTGRPAGSYGWLGIANSYFIVDDVKGLGYALSTQMFPLADPKVIDLRDEFERLVYTLY